MSHRISFEGREFNFFHTGRGRVFLRVDGRLFFCGTLAKCVAVARWLVGDAQEVV